MIRFWEEAFTPSPPPPWLRAFQANPTRAMDALLWGRFDTGHLLAADPGDLLLDWVDLLGSESELTSRLDAALAAWVNRYWDSLPGHQRRACVATAWSRLADVASGLARRGASIPQTAQALRQHFEGASRFLGALGHGPSRDPYARYLRALARTQHDRSLDTFWWELCDLIGETPFYHGRLGLEGLQGMPGPDGFRAEIARGLVRLVESLWRRAQQARLGAGAAEVEALGAGRLAVCQAGDLAAWRESLTPEIERGHQPVAGWLKRIVHPQLSPPGAPGNGSEPHVKSGSL